MHLRHLRGKNEFGSLDLNVLRDHPCASECGVPSHRLLLHSALPFVAASQETCLPMPSKLTHVCPPNLDSSPHTPGAMPQSAPVTPGTAFFSVESQCTQACNPPYGSPESIIHAHHTIGSFGPWENVDVGGLHCSPAVGTVVPAVSLQAVTNSPYFAQPSSPSMSPTCVYPKHEDLDDPSSDVTLDALPFPECTATSAQQASSSAHMHEHAAAAAALAIDSVQRVGRIEQSSTIDVARTGVLHVWHGHNRGVWLWADFG